MGGGFLARGTTGLRLGLYARVSTQEQQTLALQRDAMTAYAAQRGGAIVLAIEEVSLGARAPAARGPCAGGTPTDHRCHRRLALDRWGAPSRTSSARSKNSNSSA